MKRHKIVKAICLCVCLCILTGCGTKRQVDYIDDSAMDDASGSDAGEDAVYTNPDASLSEKLGITDTKWTETIGVRDFKGNLHVPEAKNMYVLNVSEAYLTNEDKKKIMTYFADEDTLVQDIENIITRESADRTISVCQKGLEETPESDEYLRKMYQKELDYLTQTYDMYPVSSELTEEVGDYSGNMYLGSKGDNIYSFEFYNDASRNRSAFIVNRNYEYYNEASRYRYALSLSKRIPENSYILGVSGASFDGSNQYDITKEELEKKAKDICNAVGLEDMMIIDVVDIYWASEETKQYNNYTEKNGYHIILTRDIEGIPTCEKLLGRNEENEGKLLPYSREYVELALDSEGVIYMCSSGMCKTESITGPVRLLDMESIKSVVRDHIAKLIYGNWYDIRLTYMRVKDLQNEDMYSYIPAWTVIYEGYYDAYSTAIYYDELYINAIDGTVLDTEQYEVVNANILLQNVGDYE